MASEPEAPATMDPADAPDSDRVLGENLLADGSFELGGAEWVVPPGGEERWVPFEIVEGDAAVGDKYARLALDSRKFGERSYGSFGPSYGGCGLRQEPPLEELPRYLRARYRVERWERRTENQYFQFVVGVDSAANMGLFSKRKTETAFVLGGVDHVPTDSRYRRYVFLGPKNVSELDDGWHEIEIDLHEYIGEQWSILPADFKAFWLHAELRFDSKVDQRIAHVDDVILFDDLYLGN